METLSYNSSVPFKEIIISRARKHADKGMLIAGTYGRETKDGFKGCTIGCHAYDILKANNITPGDEQRIVSENYHWPLWLCELQDTIFEGLPQSQRLAWPERIATAIPVGKDLTNIRYDFLIWMLEDICLPLVQNKNHERQADAIHTIIELHKNQTPGNDPAWCEAEDVAFAAARAATGDAARAAYWAVAVNVDWAVALEAGETVHWLKIADKIIELLEEQEDYFCVSCGVEIINLSFIDLSLCEACAVGDIR